MSSLTGAANLSSRRARGRAAAQPGLFVLPGAGLELSGTGLEPAGLRLVPGAMHVLGGLTLSIAARLDQRPDHVERKREDDRRALVAAHLGQRLQVAELDRHRVWADHVGGLGEARRRLELALRVNDLRPPIALGLGLTGPCLP